jgi:predicted HTH domain antitoxin
MQTNIIEIPQDILDSARIKLPDIKVELALLLYTQNRLSIGKARELANMSLWEFRQLLGTRKIQVHYDINDLKDDVATLKRMDRL